MKKLSKEKTKKNKKGIGVDKHNSCNFYEPPAANFVSLKLEERLLKCSPSAKGVGDCEGNPKNMS